MYGLRPTLCAEPFIWDSKIGDIEFLKILIWNRKQGVFPSWTEAKCPFKFAFRAKLASQILHSTGFSPIWTDAVCSFKWCFWVKTTLQISHLKGFFLSWTEAMCPFKWVFRANLASQILHSKGLFPSWTDGMCLFIWCLHAKLVSQIVYSKEKKKWKLNVSNLAESFATRIILYFADVWKVSARLETLHFWKFWFKKEKKKSKIECHQSCWNFCYQNNFIFCWCVKSFSKIGDIKFLKILI